MIKSFQSETEHFKTQNEPIEPKKLNSEKYTFNVDVDKKEFPELHVFNNSKFEVGNENNNFSAEFYTVTWESAELSKHNSKGAYLLTLNSGKREEKIVVYPVLEGEVYENAMSVFESNYKLYNAKLKERLAEEERKRIALIEKQEKLAADKLLKEEQIYKINSAIIQRANEATKTRSAITRAFNITQFGTWNCDSPISPPKGKTIAVMFVDTNKNKINFTTLRLVEKNKNACFTVHKQQFDKFKYNPKEQNYIFGFTADLKFAYLTPEDFDEVNNNKKHTFTMKIGRAHV